MKGDVHMKKKTLSAVIVSALTLFAAALVHIRRGRSIDDFVRAHRSARRVRIIDVFVR